jgi:hypothetical protein
VRAIEAQPVRRVQPELSCQLLTADVGLEFPRLALGE